MEIVGYYLLILFIHGTCLLANQNYIYSIKCQLKAIIQFKHFHRLQFSPIISKLKYVRPLYYHFFCIVVKQSLTLREEHGPEEMKMGSGLGSKCGTLYFGEFI
jgi:hypothetical protein